MTSSIFKYYPEAQAQAQAPDSQSCYTIVQSGSRDPGEILPIRRWARLLSPCIMQCAVCSKDEGMGCNGFALAEKVNVSVY